MITTAQGEPLKKAPIKDGRVTVYNTKTGESEYIHAIDAKERVKSGLWSYESVGEKVEPLPEADNKEKVSAGTGEKMEPVKGGIELSGPWPNQRKRVQEILKLDKPPASKRKAIEMLEQAGYTVT